MSFLEVGPIIVMVILIILFIFGIWYISVLNYLRRLEVKVEEGLSGIDVALTKRFDMLTKMLETTKGYAKHESDTLLNIVAARKGSISNMPISAKQELVDELDKVHSGINVLVEQYPELKADNVFGNLQKGIADVEEHLQAARRLYNSNVRIINEAIVTFPKSIVAKGRGINKKPFFQTVEVKREDVKIEF